MPGVDLAWFQGLRKEKVDMGFESYSPNFYYQNSRVTVIDQDRHDISRQDSILWVGDLTLSCTVETFDAAGEAIFELVEGSRRYRCVIDLQTGRGQLTYVPDLAASDDEWHDAGDPFDTPLAKPGKYTFSFANVDDRLCVWIDDRLVKPLEFQADSKYPAPHRPLRPTEADKSPVAIGAKGARFRVSHLMIERDIYYTPEPQSLQPDHDLLFKLHQYPDNEGEDEFLMLGDNSPRSNDSRLWAPPRTVSRHLLIGKAFFVYWPHAVPFLNDGRGFPVAKYHEPARRPGTADSPGPPVPKFSIPFYPNIGRMHRIR